MIKQNKCEAPKQQKMTITILTIIHIIFELGKYENKNINGIKHIISNIVIFLKISFKLFNVDHLIMIT